MTEPEQRKPTVKRIYKVEITTNDAEFTRLVRARNQAQALAHAVKAHIAVELCSVENALKLGEAGIKAEDAE